MHKSVSDINLVHLNNDHTLCDTIIKIHSMECNADDTFSPVH